MDRLISVQYIKLLWKHKNILKHVKVIEPMNYTDLIKYLSECSFVITDSGGIQEEASFLKKPCVVCRKETERREGLNNFSLLCPSPHMLNDKVKQAQELPLRGPCPYGDGNSSKKIANILKFRRRSRK